MLTNNPDKLKGLHFIKVEKRIPLIIKPNSYNEEYLKVKKSQMGHLL